MPADVLITGASGFIGSRLRSTLLEAGRDVVALRRPASPPSPKGRSAEASYEDLPGLTEIIRTERPRLIFHVAGATKGVTYEDFARANLLPTENLLAACAAAEHRPDRFVHVSSLSSYGPSTPERPLEETDTPAPIEHYGASKLAAERAVAASGIPYTILRPGGVYGPGDVDYFELFKQAERGWSVFFGNRERWFSGVYVDDLVDAVLVSAEHAGAENRGYFICDGAPYTWERFQRAIGEATGRRVREIDLPELLVPLAAWGGEVISRLDGKRRLFNRQKAKMGRQAAWTCTHQAARRDFGYRPKIDLAEGVNRAFAWYRSSGWV